MSIEHKKDSSHAGWIRVLLDGWYVGTIRPVSGGYAYFPKGCRSQSGDIFPTLMACKNSLEDV